MAGAGQKRLAVMELSSCQRSALDIHVSNVARTYRRPKDVLETRGRQGHCLQRCKTATRQKEVWVEEMGETQGRKAGEVLFVEVTSLGVVDVIRCLDLISRTTPREQRRGGTTEALSKALNNKGVVWVRWAQWTSLSHA